MKPATTWPTWRNRRLGKVEDEKTGEDLLKDEIRLLGMKMDEANGVFQAAEGSLDPPTHGVEAFLAGRGYEACNNLAHLEKKGWNYLIRLRDKNRTVAYGLKLPDTAQFDIPVQITCSRPVGGGVPGIRGRLQVGSVRCQQTVSLKTPCGAQAGRKPLEKRLHR
mgnify:CR=1 FL=1